MIGADPDVLLQRRRFTAGLDHGVHHGLPRLKLGDLRFQGGLQCEQARIADCRRAPRDLDLRGRLQPPDAASDEACVHNLTVPTRERRLGHLARGAIWDRAPLPAHGPFEPAFGLKLAEEEVEPVVDAGGRPQP